MNERALMPTLMVIQGFTAFSSFVPPLHEVRRKSPGADPEFCADVRMGEAVSGLAVVGMGAAFSYLTGSVAPLIAGVLTTAAFVAVYEYTLNGRPFSPLGTTHA